MIAALLAACAGPGDPPTVVLVVLDTVRADHLSACGYGRPTSPFLASLAAEGAFTCGAVAPASWTVPSHATFFTGRSPPEHGVAFVDGGVALVRDVHVRPLAEDVETLAERFAARGYETALVTGNPVVGHPGSGLTQGFRDVRRSGQGGPLRGERLVDAVRGALAAVGPTRPLLLVVNVMDAHDPWPAIGPEVGWVPPRPRLEYRHRDAASDYVRYQRGELPAEAAGAYLAAVTDHYDHGIRRADDVLAGVHGALRDAGRLDRPYRLVVTADHGELLGEHGRLRHGGSVLEGNVRVPLLWVTSPGRPPAWEGAVSGREVFALLATGARAPGPVEAWTEPAQALPEPGGWALARYDGDTKRVVDPAGARVYDLRADPAESAPAAAEVAPAEAAALSAWRAWAERPLGEAPPDGELLRGLGYVE